MFNVKYYSYYKRALKIFIIATILLVTVTILAFFFHPTEEFIKQLGNQSPKRVSETTGLEKVWGFIVNNGFSVPLQMVILALIPIPFLYTLNLIVSMIIPGIMLGFLISFDTQKGIAALIAYIPHYTLEIMSQCVLISCLYIINKTIIQKIINLFRKEKKQTYSLKMNIIFLVKMYLFVSLPLVVLAAFTETYIADLIFNAINSI